MKTETIYIDGQPVVAYVVESAADLDSLLSKAALGVDPEPEPEPDTCEMCGDPSGGHTLCGECNDYVFGFEDWCGWENAYGEEAY
jgi:hypothetical protein